MSGTSTREGQGFPGDPGYDPDNWNDYVETPVVLDSGYQLKLGDGDTFFGTYRGSEQKQAVNSDTGELQDCTLLLFTDKEGKRCCTFANYQLEKAFGDESPNPIAVGDRVKIEHDGKQELAGGRTFNRISVHKLVAKG